MSKFVPSITVANIPDYENKPFVASFLNEPEDVHNEALSWMEEFRVLITTYNETAETKLYYNIQSTATTLMTTEMLSLAYVVEISQKGFTATEQFFFDLAETLDRIKDNTSSSSDIVEQLILNNELLKEMF